MGGESALKDFLELYENNEPPILLSDGFPGDYLPRPLLPPRVDHLSRMTKAERIKRWPLEKKANHLEWLSLEDFNLARQSETIPTSSEENNVSELVRFGVTPKNQIDRVTNTAGGGAGQLYDMQELILPHITIFWRIGETYFDTVREFLDDLQAVGYGKRKSIGYGQVESFTLEEFDSFTEVGNANGFVTLSRFVPAQTDPTDGFWKAVVKYGKLGEEFAVSGNPYKRPLIQLAAGSCFLDSPVKEWYGSIVDGLSVRPEVKHYGFAFPISMHLPEASANA